MTSDRIQPAHYPGSTAPAIIISSDSHRRGSNSPQALTAEAVRRKNSRVDIIQTSLYNLHEMNDTRHHIVMATAELLELQGYRATSLAQVLERSAAPKGSLYHYFPGGKDELVAAAVERSAQVMTDLILARMSAGDHPAAAAGNLILSLAERIRTSDYRRGSLITTVALEAAATDSIVERACQQAYIDWQNAFEIGLQKAGCPAQEATVLASQVVGSLEGAILLSRVRRNTEPLLMLSDQIYSALVQRGDAPPALRPDPLPDETTSAPLSPALARRPVPAGWRNW